MANKKGKRKAKTTVRTVYRKAKAMVKRRSSSKTLVISLAGVAGGLAVLRAFAPTAFAAFQAAIGRAAAADYDGAKTYVKKAFTSQLATDAATFATDPVGRTFAVGSVVVITSVLVKAAKKVKLPSMKVLGLARVKVA